VCEVPTCGTDGICRYPIVEGLSCNDNNLCTANDTCNAAGECVGGTATTCPTPGQCELAGTCDPVEGTCSNPSAPDGTACDDGTVCNGHETCQSGACTAGTPPNCDDSNVCTDDSCNPASGCVNTNNTAPCRADNNACTTDQCQGGVCRTVGTAFIAEPYLRTPERKWRARCPERRARFLVRESGLVVRA